MKKAWSPFSGDQANPTQGNSLNAYRDQPEHRSQIGLPPKDDQNLAFDIQTIPEGKSASELVSYQMVLQLARSLLQQQGLTGYRWQFQVLQVPPLQTPNESMTILLSPVLQA